MKLEEILADKDFGLRMRFEKNDPATFFSPGTDHEKTLAERRKWLNHEPGKYHALRPEGEALLDETIEMAISLGTLSGADPESEFQGMDAMSRCRRLGENWGADFLLMRPNANGVFQMVGGCLCFPSHWDLGDKIGKCMSAIHGPVPGLNEAIGKQINHFLSKIKPGISWERSNWGLSRTGELNLHPSRNLPRLDSTVEQHEVWWRLEEQSLVALPKSGGILFGIKLVIKPLSEIKAHSKARSGLIRALQTMPESMADYKGVATARARLIELLSG